MMISAFALSLFSGLLLQASGATTKSAAPSFSERRVEFFYSFQVEEIPADAKKLQIWIPIPPNTPLQTVGSAQVEGNLPTSELSESVFGNRFLRIVLEGKDIPRGNFPVTVKFPVQRRPFLDTSKTTAASSEDRSRFLAPDRLVPIDGKIAEEAKKIAGAVEGSLPKARTLFDHIVGSVKYDKSGQGWGRGDAIYACDIRKGNCSDFHSLFIGEARSLGIPSRFLMGFSLPPDKEEGPIAGYHCWAEFFADERGWLPIDASEASKFPERKNEYFAVLDAHRIEFTMGRDIRVPYSVSGTVNFMIYPLVEIDGKVHGKVKNQFRFRTVKD